MDNVEKPVEYLKIGQKTVHNSVDGVDNSSFWINIYIHDIKL